MRDNRSAEHEPGTTASCPEFVATVVGMNTHRWEQSPDPPPAAALREHKTLTPPVEGDTLVAADVGGRGELVCLWAAPDAAASGRLRVAVHTATRVRTTALRDVPAGFRTAQPLPGGDLLLVATGSQPTQASANHGDMNRCDTEHNASVYDTAGNLVRSGALGDGVAHVAATPGGQVWVGYRREDGDNGSDSPDGAPGVVTFDTKFAVTGRFHLPIAVRSLNLAAETAWSCSHTGFPVVCVHDGRITSWAGPAAGARNLLVHGDRLAVLGGHGPHGDHVTAGRLRDAEFHPTHGYRLTMPNGSALPHGVPILGRGPHLHVVADNIWHRLDLDHLDRQTPARRR
jgi:hypothetical protein